MSIRRSRSARRVRGRRACRVRLLLREEPLFQQGGILGGGLNYVVGPMGSGKSMFGVRRIVRALCEGQYVVTNVRLLPGWSEAVARKCFWRASRTEAGLAEVVQLLEGRYVFETSLKRATRYRLPCAKCGLDPKDCGHSGPFQESRGVFVGDETHNDLNNRDYRGHGSSREERQAEEERRRLVIRWATQLRKLGYVGYLLSQHHENTDAQLRRVCNFLIRLQNQRTAEGFWLTRLLPRRWTLFLVYTYPAHLADGRGDKSITPTSRERYWLPWTRTLYDSWETYHGIDDEEGDDSPLLLHATGKFNTPGFEQHERDYRSPLIPLAEVGAGPASAGAPAGPHLTTTTPTTPTTPIGEVAA